MKPFHISIYLLLCLLLMGCGSRPAQPTASLQIVKTLPPITKTALPSPTTVPATPTLRPTATSIPDLPFFPTLTPAARAASSSAYQLAALTADQADEMIVRMEQLIPPLEDNDQFFGSDIVPYYRAVWYAAWNALAHFPNDPRAEAWRWKSAHYMGLSGEGVEASKQYAALLTATLNSGQITLDDLPERVKLGNIRDSLLLPAFGLQFEPISVPDMDKSYIVTIGNLLHADNHIAACFLVTQKAGTYSTYLIQQGFTNYGYSIMSRDSLDCTPRDLTDDGIDEIIVGRYQGGHAGSSTSQVFDLTSLPPQAMLFASGHGEKTDSMPDLIQESPKTGGKTQAHFEVPMGDLNCGNYVVEDYQWNGKWFELRQRNFKLVEPDRSMDRCTEWVGYYADQLPTKDAAVFLDQVINAYKPLIGTDTDLLEEFRIQKGLDLVYDGDQTGARAMLAEIVEAPFAKDSRWVEPVKNFLQTYQQPADLYRACALLTVCPTYRDASGPSGCMDMCDSAYTLKTLLSTQYASIPLDKLSPTMKGIGVSLAAQGWYDFNQDQKPELWFTVSKPFDPPDLWIAVETNTGNTAFEIGYYEPDTSAPTFKIEKTSTGQTLVDYGDYDGNKVELTVDPVSGNAQINQVIPSENAIKQDLLKFKELRAMLFAGSTPAPIYQQLVDLDRKYPNCPFGIEPTWDTAQFYDCASFYYTLAFSAELSGKADEAVKRYHSVWGVFPESPFATLARLKLK
jgi:hypothetical protein